MPVSPMIMAGARAGGGRHLLPGYDRLPLPTRLSHHSATLTGIGDGGDMVLQTAETVVLLLGSIPSK